MRSATEDLRSLAASPTAANRLGKSISRSPLSAAPCSGSMSSPNSTSPIVTFTPPMKLFKTAMARRTLSPAPARRFRSNRIRRNCGISSKASGLSSYASMETVRYSSRVAMRSISLSKTVLPTPRRPVIRKLFSGRPSLMRPSSTRACSRIVSRPANSGGGDPAPGEKGFLILSMCAPLY